MALGYFDEAVSDCRDIGAKSTVFTNTDLVAMEPASKL